VDRAKEAAALAGMGFEWQPYDSDNPMLYEYLGDAHAVLKDRELALRSYASIAEVSPGDSGLLNRAGFLLLRRGEHSMAESLFRVAIERRPDHVNNYRGLALALWYQGRFEDAVKTLDTAAARDYHGRYGEVKRILREETGLILGAWLLAKPDGTARVKELAATQGADPSRGDDLRITLHWETDACDVDLHVVDPANEECFYSHKQNRGGLRLYEDLTQGLGPETSVVPRGRLEKGAYHVGVTYFAAGPMGVSRGIVTILSPTKDGTPVAQIETFCLLPDLEGQARDLRHVAVVER
jgi:tetratricopeptide (TPR) repeat protein